MTRKRRNYVVPNLVVLVLVYSRGAQQGVRRAGSGRGHRRESSDLMLEEGLAVLYVVGRVQFLSILVAAVCDIAIQTLDNRHHHRSGYDFWVVSSPSRRHA